MRRFHRAIIGLLTLSTALGCQLHPAAAPDLGPARLMRNLAGGSTLPEMLSAPQAIDWSLTRVDTPGVQAKRTSHLHRHVLSFPSSTSPWSVGGTAGLPLSSLGAAGDTVPNGPAAAYSQANIMYFLTKGGRFIRLDRTAPTSSARVLTLGSSETFSHTSVTLSPACGRAYLLADDGTLFVVDTVHMALLTTAKVNGGYGIAPYLDPFACAYNDTYDSLYVPGNDGNVTKFVITRSASGINLTTAATYPVATGATPLAGSPYKVAAPAVVLNGTIILGDQGGILRTFDTNNTANNAIYNLGAPIEAAPAIEIQDGSYSLTDANGNPVNVPFLAPIYAFVNAGDTCCWVNLIDTSITRSMGLRIDDNDAAMTYGYLANYTYSQAGSTEYLAAVDGGNLNTEVPERNLPGYASNWSNDLIVPAETNTYDTGSGPGGGPIDSYIRWHSSASHPAGTLITSAQLSLTPTQNQACRVAEVHATSPFYQNSTNFWQSSGLTTGDRPTIASPNVGTFLSGGQAGPYGNVNYKRNRQYSWDVSAAFGSAQSDYALALLYHDNNGVCWPWGPYGAQGIGRAKKAFQVDAVEFSNNALNANAAPATPNDARPLLTLTISKTALSAPSISTPPVIDALNHCVYVASSNAVYQLDFSNPTYFADTDVNSTTGALTPHTLFNLAYYGLAGNGGGTFNNRTLYVDNDAAPAPNYDLTALYVVSRYPSPDGPSPSTWNYALSKIALPLSPTSNQLASGSPTFTNGSSGIAAGASDYLVIDPFSSSPSGGNVYFGLGNGRIYQFDR